MEKSTALDNILRYAAPIGKSKGFQNDAGAGDENSSGPSGPSQKEPVIQLPENSSAGDHVVDENVQGTDVESHGILCYIGYLILRTVFYLAVFAILATAGLYTAKLTGVYDPCKEYYFTSDVKCSVTSYMKGVIHHITCVEEQHCLLPGFLTNTTRQSWSLNKPMDVEVPESKPLSTEILQNIPESKSSVPS